MSYQDLKDKLANGDVVMLDGAVGTQLQAMGVPMNPYCWAAIANHTHPYTVRKMHEDYIRAGVDIITTNTYSAARHNYEPVGLTDQVIEMNYRAVALAQEARDRVAQKPVFIAGSISNFGGWQEGGFFSRINYKQRGLPMGFRAHSLTSVEQIKRNLRDQAEMLAEAGVDFIMAEATGDSEQRQWVLEAAASAGIPYWAGFKCHIGGDGSQVLTGYQSDELLEDELKARLPLSADVLAMFHSNIPDTTLSLPIIKAHWHGPIAAYPEAGRRDADGHHDYVRDSADESIANEYTPAEYVAVAQDWVSQGVQVIGGCCGMGLPYIQALKGQLPERVPAG